MDLKSTLGWLKIVGYAAALLALAFNYLDPKMVLSITIGISAIIKFLEWVVSVTKTTKDDEILAEVKTILKEKGIIKE